MSLPTLLIQLGPESFRFSDSVEARAVKSTERYYILRPETVEAYFYLWRLTKDQKYRDWAWDAAQVSEQSDRLDCIRRAAKVGAPSLVNFNTAVA